MCVLLFWLLVSILLWMVWYCVVDDVSGVLFSNEIWLGVVSLVSIICESR